MNTNEKLRAAVELLADEEILLLKKIQRVIIATIILLIFGGKCGKFVVENTAKE